MLNSKASKFKELRQLKYLKKVKLISKEVNSQNQKKWINSQPQEVNCAKQDSSYMSHLQNKRLAQYRQTNINQIGMILEALCST